MGPMRTHRTRYSPGVECCRLEHDRFIAWVSPVGAGLLDFSIRSPDGPPTPVLRRAPHAIDDPEWYTGLLRLGHARAGLARWAILDRTPVSARFGFDGVRLRYELTRGGLVVEARAGGESPPDGSYRIAGGGAAIDVRLGSAEPAGPATRVVRFGADEHGAGISILIRPGGA